MIGIVDHFTTIFPPKLVKALFFDLLHKNVINIIYNTNYWAHRSILALLSAYQEYLLTFKLMASQVVQRSQTLRKCLGVKGFIISLSVTLKDTLTAKIGVFHPEHPI